MILDFPKDSLNKYDDNKFIEEIINSKVIDLYKGRDDVLAILESENDIKELNINLQLLNNLSARGLIVSAKGENCDFVSRFFAPSAGVNEDPVTGSAHTSLIPYWSKRLNKTSLIAQQLSERGGVLFCEDKGNRVLIGGKAVEYLKGEINI